MDRVNMKMGKDDIFKEVKNCATVAFDLVESHQISKQSSMDNVTGWDSLGHLKLIMELEAKFGIIFTTEEIPTLTTVDIICDTIEEYLK